MRKKKYTDIFLLSFITFLCVFVVYRLWNKDFNIPFFFDQDGVGALLTIKNIADGESIWNLGNLNAPHFESSYLVDFIMQGYFIKILALFTKNVGFLANTFWILTYIFTSITTYVLLQRCGCNSPISMVGALAYSFLPYHYFRTAHFWLMGCYMIPVGVWLVLDILELSKQDLTKKKLLQYIFICILFGLNGLYYSIFLLMFVIYALLANYCNTKNRRLLGLGIIMLIVILLPAFIFMGIPAIFHFTTEASTLVEERSLYHMVCYALMPIVLLLPIPEHRIDAISKITAQLYNDLNITGENYTAHLGAFMATGLIISLLYIFFADKGKSKYNNMIIRMGKLNTLALLVGSMGGFCLIIGILVTSSVRCFNRISVFIALFSDIAICICLQGLYDQLKTHIKHKKIVLYFSSAILILFCVLEQTTSAFADFSAYDILSRQYVRSYIQNEQEYTDTKSYIEKIEKNLESDTMILQFPLVPNSTQFYQARVAVFSNKIKWSSTVTSNTNYHWLEQLSKMTVSRAIDISILYGFKGVLLDKQCYEDEFSFLQDKQVVENTLLCNPLIDSTGNMYYYSYDKYLQTFEEKYKKYDLEELRNLIENSLMSNDPINYTGQIQFVTDSPVLTDCQHKGVLQYGPYVDLEKGDYEIKIIGTHLTGSKVSCTSYKGTDSIYTTNVNITDTEITYTIHLSKDTKDIEFLLQNNSHDINTLLYTYHKKE